MRRRYGALAVVGLGLLGCAQNPTPAATSTAAASAILTADWIERAAAAVRVTDDLDDTRDCEFVSVLTVPPGWDGDHKGMTPAEERALGEMKLATARAGGNLILLYPGEEPSGEAYLCTE
jgi:hypothetical protein